MMAYLDEMRKMVVGRTIIDVKGEDENYFRFMFDDGGFQEFRFIPSFGAYIISKGFKTE